MIVDVIDHVDVIAHVIVAVHLNGNDHVGVIEAVNDAQPVGVPSLTRAAPSCSSGA